MSKPKPPENQPLRPYRNLRAEAFARYAVVAVYIVFFFGMAFALYG